MCDMEQGWVTRCQCAVPAEPPEVTDAAFSRVGRGTVTAPAPPQGRAQLLQPLFPLVQPASPG